jgi:imidazolonepropionase-like amidohydrolase
MEERRYVRAGHVVDGTGGPVPGETVLTCRDGKIVSVEDARLARARGFSPKPGEVWDLRDCTVVPGLVDCHVHLTMSGAGDPELREHQLRLSYDEAAPGIAARLGRHLARGVVALRDGGDREALTLGYKVSMGNGNVALRSAGRAWHAAGRYGKLIGKRPRDGMSLARDVALVLSGPNAPDHVKLVGSGLNSLVHFAKQTPPQFSMEEMREAVDAAQAAGRGVMVHANGREPVLLAARAGCRSIEHGFFMGEEALLELAALGTVWCPTARTMEAYAEYLPRESREAGVAGKTLEHQLWQMTRARELGVKMVVGTDAGSLGVRHGRAFRKEMALFLRAGFTLVETVQAASATGASLVGLEGLSRGLVPGADATLVAAPGPPEALIGSLASPRLVLVRGRLAAGGA